MRRKGKRTPGAQPPQSAPPPAASADAAATAGADAAAKRNKRPKKSPAPQPAAAEPNSGAEQPGSAPTAADEQPPAPVPSTWRVLSAAVIGASHRKLGLPCQDAAAWRITHDGVLLAGAADGAGSAERSAEGARLAVQAALDCLENALNNGRFAADRLPAEDTAGEAAGGSGEDADVDAPGEAAEDYAASAPHAAPLLDAFAAARQALERLADDENRPLRDFAATLSLAVAGDDYLLAGAIGDCAIVCSCAAEGGASEGGASEGGSKNEPDLHTLIPLERGEYANETHFLTGMDAMQHVRLVERPQRAIRLALFSDGLARLALQMPEQTPHKPFFAPLFAFAAGLPPAPAPGEAPPAAPLYPGQPPDAPADAPVPAGENAAIFAGAAAQLAAFLASDRVNQRTDDDKALVLAVGGA